MRENWSIQSKKLQGFNKTIVNLLGHFTRYKKIRAQWCFVLLTYLNLKMITLLLRSFFKGLQLLRNVQSESNQNDLHLQPSLTPRVSWEFKMEAHRTPWQIPDGVSAKILEFDWFKMATNTRMANFMDKWSAICSVFSTLPFWMWYLTVF